jgi:hypothetical protein
MLGPLVPSSTVTPYYVQVVLDVKGGRPPKPFLACGAARTPRIRSARHRALPPAETWITMPSPLILAGAPAVRDRH